jgi:simple sugar transport system ATP-binding protein/ribose transport system ATP-binding protein
MLVTSPLNGAVKQVTLPDKEALLTLTGVEKRFGGAIALTGIDLAIYPGEVHALVGENGAGKSTLGKILFGAHAPDMGKLLLNGTPIQMNTPADGLRHGLVGIAQELSLMPTRSVTDNIMLAQELGRGPFVSQRANRQAVLDTIERYGLAVDPDALVADLPISQQQRVEILRALSRDTKLIVFDEPTARLSGAEANTVRAVVRKLADAGCAVVYVSHFLDEVLAISDRITILRNGELMRSGPAQDETRESLIETMTGTGLSAQFPPLNPLPADAREILSVTQLQIAGTNTEINLSARAGEIVGLSGLVGAGRSEIGQAIMGAHPANGSVMLDGVEMSGLTIAQRIDEGVSYIPESRRDQGLMMMRPIQENVGLPFLKRISGLLGLSLKEDAAQALKHCTIATVKYGDLSDDAASLSGGNQQKVLFARASLSASKLLIVDEPTRGVDVGAKRKIYDLVTTMAANGTAVILISSELEEIIGLCHRVDVIANGAQVAHFSNVEMSEKALMHAAFTGV